MVFPKKDFSAGFIVFLMALPLCVGISIASGAPATAGVITAIIGGLLGSFFSGSPLTINGPAAGLIATVLLCVEELGQGDPMMGYKKMLACTVIAGMFQLFLGFMRAGTLGLAFPSTVVHAMLASIGIIISAKQAYVLFGLTPTTSEALKMIWNFPTQLASANIAIASIGISCLFSIIFINELAKKNTFFKKIPTPLISVLLGIMFSLIYDLEHPHVVQGFMANYHISVDPKSLLSVPDHFLSAFYFPDFSEILSLSHWKHIVMITFIATTESILSTCAIDRLDPLRRRSDLNQDLIGKGLCNMMAGMVGGLPMISEIVRSSANVANGAQSQKSNFFHGFFLLIFLMSVPQYLHMIPLASLAAILVYVGYQLCKPTHFFHTLEKGKGEAFVFISTIIMILATDILVGVFFGSLLEMAVLAYRGKTTHMFKLKMIVEKEPSQTILKIYSPVTFTHFLSLRGVIEKHNQESLVIDLEHCSIIDSTTMEHLLEYQKDFDRRQKMFQIIFSHHHSSPRERKNAVHGAFCYYRSI